MRPYMTEEEAKTKHCPAARTLGFTKKGGGLLVSVNRWEGGSTKCVGSGCMFWGWEEHTKRRGKMPDLTFERFLTGLGRCEAPGGAQ